jgi:hypothetical protein
MSIAGVYKPPLSIASRVLAVFWWFFCLVTIATYVAAMVQTTGKSGTLQRPRYTEFGDLLSAPKDFKFGGVSGAETTEMFKRSRTPEFRMAWER